LSLPGLEYYDRIYRERNKPVAKIDPLERWVERQRNAEIKENLFLSASPDTVARVNRLSRATGEPPILVEDRIEDIERAISNGRFLELAEGSPKLARWAVNNPRSAAAAADDHIALNKLSSAFDADAVSNGLVLKAPPAVDPTLWNSLKGIWANLVGGAEQARTAAWLAANDWRPELPWETAQQKQVAAQGYIKDINRQRSRMERATPAFQSKTAVGIYSGASSLARMAPAVALSVAVRNPSPAITVAGAQTGLEAYGKYRVRGGTKREALLGASIEGGIEAATELLPMKTIVDGFGKAGAGRFLSELIGRELVGEQIATFVQDAVDTAIANPEKTWADFLSERPDAAYQTAVATLVSSGVLSGMSAVAGYAAKRKNDTMRARAEHILLDTIAEGAEASKLKSRDAEEFRALVATLADDTQVENVYVPAEKVREYMQSDSYIETDFWRANREQIGEAYATGGDVVIPVADAAAYIAGTPAWKALKPDMRLSPGGVSQNEALQFEVPDSAVEKMMRQVGGESARANLFSNIYDKLTNVGFTPATARVQAELLAQRYVARAGRLGRSVTGKEFDYVQIRQVLPERLSRVKKADQIDVVIRALRRDGAATKQRGKSLLEWIADRGGINDSGGDLRAAGLENWHKEKPFRKRIIRAQRSAGLLGPSGDGMFGADVILQDAIDEGYFPELQGSTELVDGNILLEAIADEISGKPRFAQAAETDVAKAAADELVQLLESAGQDVAAMSDQDIRGFVDRFLDGASEGKIYMQDGENGPRASISFPAQALGKNPVIINLFNSRNLSSFLHEAGHLFLEELRMDASAADAPESLKQDWELVMNWFRANGHDIKNEIPVAAHELWARGFERYLFEGKAPTSTLQSIFDTVRSWLVALYRRVENLQAPINADIRAVMDRLLATDEEIQDQRSMQQLDPVFATALEAGMTGAEFDAYMELVAAAKSTAHNQILEKTMRVLKERDTKRYKALEADVRTEVIETIDNLPEFRALAAARANPLNSEWVKDRYGEAALSMLPKQVPPVHRINGADPDTIAEIAGLADGRELVELLMGIEQQRVKLREGGDMRSPRQALIDQQTADAMAERYGDPFNDGSIEEEALSAVHNDLQGEVISAEIRALGRNVGAKATPYAVARQWARLKVRSGSVRGHLLKSAIQQYRRNAARNGQLAFEALASGNKRDAFRFKQAQLVNNALVREAREAMAEVEAAIKRLENIAAKKTIKSVDQDYLEQAHALMEAVDLKPRSQRKIDRQGKFETWARERQAEGYDIVVPPSFEATIGQTNWTRLSAEELLGLDAAVRQIIHLGRLKRTLLDNNEQRDFDAVVSEALNAMERLPRRKARDLTDPGRMDQFRSFALSSHASLLKMETVFTRLTGKGGAFDRIVFRPIAEAQASEKRLMREYLAELDRHLATVPEKLRKSWFDAVTIPDLFDRTTGEPLRLERAKLISMALNMGNEGNAAKLTGGYGWSENAVLRMLNRELAPEEWLYVQSVWDTVNKLWPQIAELERRVNGIAPDKVAARPIETSAGTLAGGYFPVVYDPSRNLRSEELSARSTDQLFLNSYSRATTSQGFTKARTDVERPIHLSLDVITRHIAEVIHDITHREAIIQADKFLGSARIAKAVDETLGPEVRRQFRPWLQHIANEWAYDRAGLAGFDKFLRGLRRNSTFVGMGYRISTMLVQAAGYTNSFERVGAKWVLHGLNLFLRSPRRTTDFVLATSLEVRDRLESLDRDISDRAKAMAGKSGVLEMVNRYAFAGIGYMDRTVVVPTWLGAYNRALAEGLEEREAVFRADSAVRESQGAGAAKDLAAVQVGKGASGETMKLLTMFYSFQSAQYNRFVTMGWDIADSVRERRVDLVPEIAARAWWMIAVAPVLSALLSGQTPDTEDEEGWAEWSLKLSLFNLSGPIPVVRDAAPVLYGTVTGKEHFPYRFTPAQGAIETALKSAGDLGRLVRGEETKRATRNALETIGYATGAVPGQFAASAQFFVDVLSGDSEPETIGDWWKGITKGRIED